MRALLPIIIAAVALCAAGCAASEPSDYDQATLTAIDASQQRLNTLSDRIDANQLDTDKDIDAYISDMRSAAVEFDALRGTLQRLPPVEEAKDELADYGTQLGTTAKLARELATAVEDRDEQDVGRTETAYVRAGAELSTLATAVNAALVEAQ